MEEWKLVPGFPNYRISNLGRLQSSLSGEWRDRKLKLINKGNNYHKTYYYGFNAVVEGERLPSGQIKKITLKIHKLVAELFIGPNPGGMLVLHIDDDRSNNRWDNLKYGTQSENVSMSFKNNNLVPVRGERGRFNGTKRRGT